MIGTCCEFENQITDDDGEVIYPAKCECICHTEDD